jgi:hypothetical protein
VLPAFSQGTVAFFWAVGLGLFVFVLMLGIAVGLGTSLVVSIVSGLVIFFAVLLFGQDRAGRES